MTYYSELIGDGADHTVIDLAAAHAGYAKYLVSLEQDVYLPYIASSNIIAACLSSLVNPVEANALFRQAAYYYKKDRNPYWKIAAICANDTESLGRAARQRESDEIRSQDETNPFVEMLSSQFIFGNNRVFSTEENGTILRLPGGRLGIPFLLFEDAFLEFSQIGKDVTKIPKCSALLIRASETVNSMLSDRSEWDSVSASFIPFEPEILAACMCFMRIANSNAINVLAVRNKIEADPISLLPFDAAIELNKVQGNRGKEDGKGQSRT